MSVRLAIYDLDDTLFDHRHAAECGVRALQTRLPAMAGVPLDELMALYQDLLNRFHLDILAGRETTDSARPKRYRAFLEGAGVAASPQVVEQALACYRQGYDAGRRAVPGAAAVLAELRRRQVRIAVLTNHYSGTKQRQKVVDCGLTEWVDDLFVSADLGLTKPDPAAFRAVLQACDVDVSEAVMVGDSLTSDVEGAVATGLRAVWLNRHGADAPQGVPFAQLQAFEPTARAVEVILGSAPGVDGARDAS